MREIDQSRSRRCFKVSAKMFLSFLFAILATGSGAAAEVSDEHLPEKARVVAEKFERFKQTASPRELDAKRVQVIDYLDSLLKQEAADADLEGALAVRDLIRKIREGAAAKPAPGGAATTQKAVEGLSTKRFSLGQKRRIEYPFLVNRSVQAAVLRCEISGAGDDSGDRGLHYELIGPSGKVVKRGFLQSTDGDLVMLRTTRSGIWKIAVIDEDTETTGDSSGNNGSVRVSVRREPTAVASSR